VLFKLSAIVKETIIGFSERRKPSHTSSSQAETLPCGSLYTLKAPSRPYRNMYITSHLSCYAFGSRGAALSFHGFKHPLTVEGRVKAAGVLCHDVTPGVSFAAMPYNITLLMYNTSYNQFIQKINRVAS
jgi:hypothetical protein